MDPSSGIDPTTQRTTIWRSSTELLPTEREQTKYRVGIGIRDHPFCLFLFVFVVRGGGGGVGVCFVVV